MREKTTGEMVDGSSFIADRRGGSAERRQKQKNCSGHGRLPFWVPLLRGAGRIIPYAPVVQAAGTLAACFLPIVALNFFSACGC